MLRAYFDESGTHPNSRIAVMAGLLSSPLHWESLSRSWRRTLKRYGVEGEYKGAHCLHGEGAFAHLAQPRRNRLRVDLGRIVQRHVRYVCVVGVLRDDFRAEVARMVGRGITFSDPYPWCVRTCLEYIAKSKARGRHKVACVFDAGHGFQRRMFDYFPTLYNAKKWGDIFYPSLTAAASDRYAPLQAAEWCVYELRQDMDHQYLGTQLRYDCYSGMLRDMTEGGHFDRDALRGLVRPLFAYHQRGTWDLFEQITDERAGERD
jgi:hypothetical protein